MPNSEVINRAVLEVEAELNGKGRVILRPSGTEPLIRVTLEGADSALVDRLANAIGRHGSHRTGRLTGSPVPQQVPVLDLERFASDRERLVSEVGAAYREFGFCGFVNHGISGQVIDNAYAVFRQFFALPARVKLRYRSGVGGQRGYTPFGVEQARDQQIPDLKEFWHTGREMGADNPWPDILQSNPWPAEIPGFETHAYALYRSLDALGRQILEIIALALGLEQDWFDCQR